MRALAIALAFLLTSCHFVKKTTTPKPVEGERGFWHVCWKKNGYIDYPSDAPPHAPKCLNPVYPKWELPIKVYNHGSVGLLSWAVQASITQWNYAVGIELFETTKDPLAADVFVVYRPEMSWIRGQAIHRKREGKTAAVVLLFASAIDDHTIHTVTHELGHVLYLAHDLHRDSIMYGSNADTPVITEFDKWLLRKRYAPPKKKIKRWSR